LESGFKKVSGFAAGFAGCVWGSRIRKEKVADSKMSGYVWRG